MKRLFSLTALRGCSILHLRFERETRLDTTEREEIWQPSGRDLPLQTLMQVQRERLFGSVNTPERR